MQQQLDQERVKLRRLEQKVYEAKELRDIAIQVDAHVFPACSVTKHNESINVLPSLQAQLIPARTSYTTVRASFKKIVCVKIPVYVRLPEKLVFTYQIVALACPEGLPCKKVNQIRGLQL